MDDADAVSGRQNQRREGRDVFTKFRRSGHTAEPTRLAPARDELARGRRLQRIAMLRAGAPGSPPEYADPYRIVVYGTAATIDRAFEALTALERSIRTRTAARAPTRGVHACDPAWREIAALGAAIQLGTASAVGVEQADDLLTIARAIHVDLLLMNPGRLGIKSPAVDAWLAARAWMMADDGYPAAVVLLTDEHTGGQSRLVAGVYGIVIHELRENAPLDVWIDIVRRAPGRRLTRLLGEGAGGRLGTCGLLGGPFVEALNAVFDDIARLVPFTPARDAGATLAALSVGEATVWNGDQALNPAPELSRRAMQSARKHLARRLSRVGLPSADHLVRLVRVAYAIGIARAWRVSLDQAARDAGFRTGRQLMTACPRVAGAPFGMLVRRLAARDVTMHFALMLFRDYWNDVREEFEWTFQDLVLTAVPAPELPGGRAMRIRTLGNLVAFEALPHTDEPANPSLPDG